MPKIFCALFEGVPVRYIHLKRKNNRRTWFFHEDVSKALGISFRTEHLPVRVRFGYRVVIAGEEQSINLLSLEGIFFITAEADLARAARFLAFLSTCGIVKGV